MLKIKILFWLFAPLTIVGTITTPTILSTLNQQRINDKNIKKESYINRTISIIDDIKNINTEDEVLQVKVILKEKFYKALRIIFQFNQSTMWNEFPYTIDNIPKIDFTNKQVSTTVSHEITYKWFDRMHGWFGDFIRKKSREIKLKIPQVNFKTNLVIKNNTPYANFYEYDFDNRFTTYSWIKDLDTSRSYGLYYVKNITSFYYKYQMTEHHSYIIKNKIQNIWTKFVEFLPLRDNDETYNLNTIKSQKIIRFNKHFSTLYELNKIADIYNELNSKDNKEINEKIFLDQLRNYQFYSYENVKYKYNFLKETGILKPLGDNDNFNQRVSDLLNNVLENYNKENHIGYDEFKIIYQILINYFAVHDIKMLSNFNGLEIQSYLWKNRSFKDIFEQFPREVQEKRNIQILDVHKIIDERNNTNQFYFDKYEQNHHKKYKINFRWNAQNKNPNIKEIKRDGVLLNINKYIHQIIYDDKLIDQKRILNTINNEIFGTNIFNDVEVLSNKNWKLISKLIDINQINKFFNLNNNEDNFNFIPNDTVGTFYALVNINDLKFNDGSSGEYHINFKNNLLKNINKHHNNILEIPNSSADTAYIIKLQTNRIHII